MRRLVALLAVVLAATVAASAASGAGSARPRVTLFGDSVAAALTYDKAARAALAKGFDFQLDAKVCRRLAEIGCPYNGDRPSSVLSLVQKPATPLGSIVVIDVGYNDVPSDYGDDIDKVMQALVKQGVATVIWVTMQENRPLYRPTNAAIAAAARKWPQIMVADWHGVSSTKPTWFVDDGLHLTTKGAMGLARFLRPLLVASSCNLACLRAKRADEG